LSIAYVFPGQGSQSVGMGRSVARASSAAAAVWTSVDVAVGAPISQLAWEGPGGELDLTVNAQPALLAASVAAWRALPGEGRTRPAWLAGHSMGQYSAMVAAGVLALADAARLVRERGRLMQDASPDGAMAAIIGLDEEREGELLAAGATAGVVTVANRNSPGQIVISGDRRAVQVAAEAARDLGARRAILLPVSVAAHSPLMEPAARGMRDSLATVPFVDPSVPLIANADASALTTAEACRAELIDHLTRGVDWVRTVGSLVGSGVDTFVEVGPGTVLVGLIRRIVPHARAISTDELVTDEGLVAPTPMAAPAQPATASQE
jgi:[acyl-carrier-protein] S-malonyltransferase